MNLDYWNNYYSQQNPQINQQSLFAQHILDNYQFSSIIDFGCGNGRDSIFFNKSGKKVLACDFSSASISSINSSETLITKEVDFEIVEPRLFYREFNEYDAGYARFFLCAISDIGIHKFLKCARYSIKQDGLLFIECRSDKGQLSDTTHDRNLINIDRLKQLLNDNLFEIKSIEENSGFSPTDKEDPILIRCVAINKNCTKYSGSCKSIRSCCTDKLRDMLFDVVDLLEKNDIQYWIDFGTLLGAIRGQDIIKWDKDVDISVYSNHRSKIESLKKHWNCGERKSLTLEPPKQYIKDDLALATICGFFEGDGCFYYSTYNKYITPTMGYVGTFDFLNWIRNILSNICPEILESNILKMKTIYSYKIAGKKALYVREILKKINCPHILDRKWKI